MNCLTGLITPTFGSAFIFGHSVSNIHRIQRHMGVCMQDDLLFSELTARETIAIFAAVRGIAINLIADTVNAKLKQFHMNSYSEKKVAEMSGGMKRRLSLSLATLGDPKVVSNKTARSNAVHRYRCSCSISL